MDENKIEYQEIDETNDFKITRSGGDYALVEEGEPYEAHITDVKRVWTENFDKTETVEKAVVYFELDEGDGQGQVYTKWITPSSNPKSVMYTLLNAVFGDEWPEDLRLKKHLPGRTLRILFENKNTDNGTRQNVKGFLKRSKNQPETVEVKVAEASIDEEGKLDYSELL